MKILKRFFALLTITSIICCPIGVYAKDASSERIPTQEAAVDADKEMATDDGIAPASLGKLLASRTTTIYGGSGTLTVNLPSSNWWADFVAGIGYTEQSGIVTCSVLTPDGNTYDLGDISGTGSQTGALQLTYAPAGNYTFYFSSAITTPYDVIAYIYD